MEHSYSSHICWTGNLGKGTSGYRSYDRTWDISVAGKEIIHVLMIRYGGDAGK